MKVLIGLVFTSCLMAQGWTDLGGTTTLQSVCPPSNGSGNTIYATYDFPSYCPGVYHDFSGGVVDTKRNRLLMWGGGHAGYSGNEMYALYLTGTLPSGSGIVCSGANAPAMCRLNAPSPWDYSVSCTVNADGTPTARHTWDGIIYDQLNDVMIAFGGGINSTCGPATTQDIWKASFNSVGIPTWSQVFPTGASMNSFNAYNRAIYDPVSQSIFVDSNGNLYNYVTATNVLTLVNNGGMTLTSNGGAFLAVDPVRERLYWFGKWYGPGVQQVLYMDISHGTTYTPVDISANVSGCSGSTIDNYAAPVVWDTNISRFVGYGGDGQTVLIFDPGSDTCVSQTFSSPSVPSSGGYAIYGRFGFISNVGKYVMCNNPTSDCFSFTLSPNGSNGLGHTTLTCVDIDGDGYGVGAGCLGPDADDNDSSVHTASDVITKYGTLAAFINHIGYNPTRLWIVSPSGNDGTCTVGTLTSPPSPPCQTWLHVYTSGLTAGDMVMGRTGNYIGVTWGPPSGTSGNPIIIMGYPGEQPFIDNRVASGGTGNVGVDFSFKNWIVIDGVKSAGGLGSNGCVGGGGPQNNIIIRHTDTTECYPAGIAAFDGLVDFTIEYNVAHDMNDSACGSCQHVLYMGSRTNPSSNIAIRRNLWYNPAVGGWPAYQFNGRMSNTTIEQNIIYGTDGSAMSLLNGISYSRIMDNLMFNNNGGLNISNYDGDCYIAGSTGICPYNQTGNLVANNTFYIGDNVVTGLQDDNAGISVSNVSTGCYPAFNGGPYSMGDHAWYSGTNYTSNINGNTSTPPTNWTSAGVCTLTKQGNLGGNTFTNNIFENNANGYMPLSYALCQAGTGAAFSNPCIYDSGDTTLSTSIYIKNIIWGGVFSTVNVLSTVQGTVLHTIANLNTGIWSPSSVGNTNIDPLFVSASPSYWNTPTLFNLRLKVLSTGISSGASSIPMFDLVGVGNPPVNPNIGTYEGSVGSIIPNFVSSKISVGGGIRK